MLTISVESLPESPFLTIIYRWIFGTNGWPDIGASTAWQTWCWGEQDYIFWLLARLASPKIHWVRTLYLESLVGITRLAIPWTNALNWRIVPHVAFSIFITKTLREPIKLSGAADCGRNVNCFQLRIPLNYTMLQAYNCDRQKGRFGKRFNGYSQHFFIQETTAWSQCTVAAHFKLIIQNVPISNWMIQSAWGPNRKRHDDSAAYWDDRSPTLSTLFGLLLHTWDGQLM